MICLDLIYVEIAAGCTFKRKYPRSIWITCAYILEMQKNRNEIFELDLFSFRPLYLFEGHYITQ